MKGLGLFGLVATANAYLAVRDTPQPPSKVATITAGSSESPMPCVVNFLPDAPAVVISCSLTSAQGPAQPTVTSAPHLVNRDVAHPPSDPGYEFLHLSANIDVDFIKSRCPACSNGTIGEKYGNYTHSYGVSVSGTATANQSVPLRTTMSSIPTKLSSTMALNSTSMKPASSSSRRSSSSSSSAQSLSTTTESTEAPKASTAASSNTTSQATPSKSRSSRSFKPPATLQSSSTTSETSTTETSLGVGFLDPTPPGVSSSIDLSGLPKTLTPNPTITFQDLPRTTTIDPFATEYDPSSSASDETSQEATSSATSSTNATASPSSRSQSRPSSKQQRPQSTTSSAEIASSTSSSEDPTTTQPPAETSSPEPSETSSAEPTEATNDPQLTANTSNSDIMTDSLGFTWSVRESKASTQAAMVETSSGATTPAATTSSSAEPAASKASMTSQEPHYIPWECDEKTNPYCFTSRT